MIDTARQAALKSLPPEFPAPWATDWGVDAYGLWMGLTLETVRQVFRWIPPGRFQMGSPPSEPERSEDETQHEVALSEGYWLAATACTQALWQAVMGENPSFFEGTERPLESVSWDDTKRFIYRINQRVTGLGLRLPSEAEWEYACRAGTPTPFWFGENISTEQVNYDGSHPYARGEKGEFRKQTVEVKALPCNSLGLYQMHGNVWEWCSDFYGPYAEGPVTDPQGPESGGLRVLRGGGWDYYGRSARSARRNRGTAGHRYSDVGFRLARSQ